jgi:DNA-binding FadR family transcriptional regulator
MGRRYPTQHAADAGPLAIGRGVAKTCDVLTVNYNRLMTTEARTPAKRVRAALSSAPRIPAERLGISVVRDLVDSIVSGAAKPGETLPPEALLAAEFAVSRTVIRESIKRIEEKGLVQVEQGRGTIVSPTNTWNVLDPDVLDAMIVHDDSLGILDEVVSVRALLESEMAATAASLVTDAQVEELRAALEHMRNGVNDLDAFPAGDVAFHAVIMNVAQSRLGASISRVLVGAAMESSRYRGESGNKHFNDTLNEHAAILKAISERDVEGAHEAMRHHIVVAWERRRPPVGGRSQS